MTETVTEAVREREEAAAELVPAEAFAGDYLTFSYPSEWTVETAEVSKGDYVDTTLRDSRDHNVMFRVDVSPRSYADPAEKAAEVEAYLVDEPRYRRLRYEATSFLGYDAFRWDFLVDERGVLLRKSDVFFTTATGDTVAVLIQAPASGYRRHLAALLGARGSLELASAGDAESTYDGELTEDAAGFCTTHECIENFDEGNGNIAQCADGTWSHSGGIQGACSHHGGLAGGPGSAGHVSGYDPNNDGSTTNWCGASRDGDGDGLWCEGR